jgi:sRNA-binding carbon storage regulator CsrA
MGFFEKVAVKRIKSNPRKTLIDLCINSENELYNHFSKLDNVIIAKADNAKINNEIIEYLIMETEKIDQRDSLKIGVKAPEKQDVAVEQIERLIKENINEKLSSLNGKIRRTNSIAFILIFIGMALVGVTQIFQVFENRYSFNEFIIVMGWVFMWKAIELLIFDRFKLIKEKAILMKIYYSKIILG